MILWWLIIEALDDIFNNVHNDQFIDELIILLNHWTSQDNLIWRGIPFDKEFFYHFRNLKKLHEENIWIIPIQMGKVWWWYLFIMKKNISRSTLFKVTDAMREGGFPNICVDYASWIDGTWNKGCMIDQYITKWVFSKYIPKTWSYCIKNWVIDYVWEYQDILEAEKDGLVLDTINNKIYINWEKMTAKELKTQTTTIDILQILSAKMWEDINNKTLTRSAYSTNKNEMMWKIVLPLIRLISEKTWHKLHFICKWSLSDFFLRLNKSPIDVILIKSMWTDN